MLLVPGCAPGGRSTDCSAPRVPIRAPRHNSRIHPHQAVPTITAPLLGVPLEKPEEQARFRDPCRIHEASLFATFGLHLASLRREDEHKEQNGEFVMPNRGGDGLRASA